MRYQAALLPDTKDFLVRRGGVFRWARQDSNPRPSRYERPALTAELQAPKKHRKPDRASLYSHPRQVTSGDPAPVAPALARGCDDLADRGARNAAAGEFGIDLGKPAVEFLDLGLSGDIGGMTGGQRRAVK